MQKDAYYFPHFSNARHDRKIKRVSKELGIEGYGIYFMLLEVLREQPDLRYPMSDIDLLSDEFGTSEQKVRTVICNYQLFEIEDNEKFFSPKLIEYLQPYFKMKEQRRIAGEASAAKRLFNDRSTTVQQSKVKESKEKETNIDTSLRSEQFEKFWEYYGKKGSKKTAKDRFMKLSENDLEQMRAHLPHYLKATPDRKFRKDAERYLSNKLWENGDIEQLQKNKPKLPDGWWNMDLTPEQWLLVPEKDRAEKKRHDMRRAMGV